MDARHLAIRIFIERGLARQVKVLIEGLLLVGLSVLGYQKSREAHFFFFVFFDFGRDDFGTDNTTDMASLRRSKGV